MNHSLPLVSVVMATYNRATSVERAIDSVLKQTYKNIELIIIDDGSTDNTREILRKYEDTRIRIYNHESNKGVTAAKNSGLKQILGEWFTIFDSDDEMASDAIETLIQIPLSFDQNITAVTCNCFDTTTKNFSGRGLHENQYINVKTIMATCQGEFWGITKTSLLQNDLFNEKLKGYESVLWYKIDDRANRYYVHKALRIYHTEGDDRISKSNYNFDGEVKHYENLIDENFYLSIIRKHRLKEYNKICKKGIVIMRVSGNKDIALKYYELSKLTGRNIVNDLIYRYKSGSLLFKHFFVFKNWLKPFVYSFLKK